MTTTNQSPGKAPPPEVVSLNDSLVSTNPPLWLVLTVLGSIGLAALVLTFHASLGF